MLDFQLMAQHFGDVRPLARLTQKPAARDPAKRAIDRHHPAIEGDFLPGIFEFIDDPGRLPELDRNRGHDPEPLAFDRVAERARILVEADEAHAHGIAQRGLHIGIGAPGVERARQQPDLARAVELGPLGDEVDRAPRLAAAEQRRARTFQDFDRLDPRKIARAGKPAPGVEAIDKVIARQVLVPHEAAHREGIPKSAEIVLPRNRSRQVKRGIEVKRVDVAHLLLADHLFGLRDFQRREFTAIGRAGGGDGDVARRLFGGGGFGAGLSQSRGLQDKQRCTRKGRCNNGTVADHGRFRAREVKGGSAIPQGHATAPRG